MKKINIKQKIGYMFLLVFLCITLVACGKNENGEIEKDSSKEDTQEESVTQSNLFLIVEHNTIEETLTLYSFETELEHYYTYSFSTQFKDKYGNFSPAAEFTAGRVVTIGKRDLHGNIMEVQLSDAVWEYEDVSRYSIDESSGVFTIADTRYSIRDKVYIFSNGKNISFAEISPEDVLTVIGQDKKIYSVVVTTGHGTLALSNTELFHDSYLQLNNDIFTLIYDSMELELPEGRYTLKVAKDGWGGTTEIDIIRGEKTEIDLDTLKGEGKKKGLIKFEINAEDVKVYIDKQLVEHTNPVELTYGTHLMEIKASGYDTWKKYLSVNSAEATIGIELTGKSEAESEAGSEGNSQQEAESEAGSEENSQQEAESEAGSEGNSQQEAESEAGSEGSSQQETESEENNQQESESEDSTTQPSIEVTVESYGL